MTPSGRFCFGQNAVQWFIQPIFRFLGENILQKMFMVKLNLYLSAVGCSYILHQNIC
jgi:hypothetical protein